MEELNDEDTLELTHYKEGFSAKAQQVAELMADKALSELIEAGGVTFDPKQEAAELDAIKAAALFRLNQVATINVQQLLTEQRQRRAQLVRGESSEEVILDEGEPELKEILALEKDLSKILDTYSSTIQSCMKEKRLLSGQLYGAQGSQGQNLSRAATMQKIVARGSKGLEALSRSGALGFTPNEEMELAEQAKVPKPRLTQEVKLPDYAPAPNFDPVVEVLGASPVKAPIIPIDDDEDVYCEEY